jgi:ribosomal protein S18 acetylase RimI-like enzyme
MTAHQIVPIAEEHIASFHEALDVVARERKYLALLEAPPLERVSDFVLANIEQRHPQFVALDADAVVGWCDIIPHARAVYAHCGTMGMGILPQYRGQGLGRKLMEATIAAAFAFGMTRIELIVRRDNANAITLYESLGFEIEGLHRNAIFIDGRYEHQYSMALMNLDEQPRG